jgi:c(7)-type cytochrome triheme protein
MMRILLALAVALVLALLPVCYGAAEVGDIPFTRKTAGADDFPPAVFPHWLHRMQFKCHVCHESVFKMKAGANPVTMDAINEGKYCGTCHNGKRAFAPMFEHCSRCHRQ